MNPDFHFEGRIVKGLYGMAGGGFSLGYGIHLGHRYASGNEIEFLHNNVRGKFGLNALLGLEYKFDAPCNWICVWDTEW